MVVATVAFCLGGVLLGGAGIFVLLNLGDYRALRTLRRMTPVALSSVRGGRVAVQARTEYGPSGRHLAPVTGEDCAWFHVRLIREPSRHYVGSDDPDHDVLADFTSPDGFALADPSGRVPVDPAVLDISDVAGPRVPVTTTLEHRLKAPIALPAVVPREVVDDLRKSERLTLTEVRVPRAVPVFALGRVSRGQFKRSLAGLTAFTTSGRERVIAGLEDSIRHVSRVIVVFALAGLVLAGGGAGYLTTLA